MRFALTFPERAKTLTLNAPILFSESGGNQLTERNFRPATASSQQRESFRRLHGDDWADAVNVYLDLRNSEAFQRYYDLRELVGQVRVPTFVMRGDQRQDALHPLAHAFQIYQSLPNAQLLVYPNAHNNIEEYDPEFRAMLRSFLLRHR
jgi:pimeloyl-ACP methyl ester carboxylesterase